MEKQCRTAPRAALEHDNIAAALYRSLENSSPRFRNFGYWVHSAPALLGRTVLVNELAPRCSGMASMCNDRVRCRRIAGPECHDRLFFSSWIWR